MKQLRTFALAAALALAAGCSGVSDEEWCAKLDYPVSQFLVEECVYLPSKSAECERCIRCGYCCYGYPPHITNPKDCEGVEW